jgi:nitrile hydratase subunit beta
MKLQHHLGGLEGLGPVYLEKRVFAQPWEQRIFGIHVAMMALSKHLPAAAKTKTTFREHWTWGHLRSGAEAMNPFDYFVYRYYEKWLGGISSFFIEKGYVTAEELASLTARYLADASTPKPQKANPAIDEQVVAYLTNGDSPRGKAKNAPAFRAGQSVRVKDVPPVEHTRLPGHLRGKTGVIDLVYDGAYGYFFPTGDGIGDPMAVYCVRFDPVEIWGPAKAEPNTVVYADLFEAYLEA